MSAEQDNTTTREEASVAPHDRDADEWAHVDPAHPRPWEGCIRRGVCCQTSPGWFAPGEAERVAARLGIDMGALVNRYLVLDRIETTVGRIEAFVPVKLGRDGRPAEPTGGRTSDSYYLGKGPCIFYDGAGCSIHGVHPLECRLYDCTVPPEDNPRKLDLALLWLGAWKAAQDGLGPFPPEITSTEELRAAARQVRSWMGAEEPALPQFGPDDDPA